ncbi:VanZ family protein [Streptomyces chumphonensis]|uniref:VanZ family protein n=1 Tax=Streptomyces chumphonensis TaxID=1214925 RepID=UPI003D726218
MPPVQRHRPTGRAAVRLRTAGRLLLAGYLLAVGWLTLRPRAVPWVEPSNVTLFATVRSAWAGGPAEAFSTLGGQLLLLAPLGALLPLASGALGPRTASFVRTVLATAALSLAVEVARTSVPGQTGDVDAVLLNSAGAALVHLALYPVVRRRLRRAAVADPAARNAAGTAGTVPQGAGAVGAGGAEAFRRRAWEETSQGRTPRTPRVRIAP